MTILTQNTPLVLIDVQEGFNDPVWGERNNPSFEENLKELLEFWRKTGMPVIHVQHLSKEENSPLRSEGKGVRFMRFAEPRSGEQVVTKTVNSAFIGTDLELRLLAIQADQLVIAGLTTDHCVSTSVRMAKNIGFGVVVVDDATATFNRSLPDGTRYEAELVHRVSIASLNHEFAKIQSTDEMIRATQAGLE